MNTEKQTGNATDSVGFCRITVYRVDASGRSTLMKSISDYVDGALQATGNMMAEGYWESGQENTFWLIERWNDQDAWRNFHPVPVNAGALKNEFKVNDLEPLSKSAWQKKADPADRPFTAVLMLQTKPGTQDEFKQIYHEAMPLFRGEPGVITYQLSQSSVDSTMFITYEKFRSNDAFQYHLNFPPIKPVINFLRNSIQDPPFEKGLHHLILFAPKNI